MPSPLGYRPPPEDEALKRKRDARNALLAGVCVLAASVLVVFSPLVLGRWSLNKYLVAFGLFGTCLGASFMLHGTIDWLRARRCGR